MTAKAYATVRSHFRYYQYIQKILSIIGAEKSSILDVGSNGVDIISHLDIPHKVSLDLENPLKKKGILSIKADWLEYTPSSFFDIVTCCQVLEHIQDVETFTRKLFVYGKSVLISVPYRWKKGRNITHIHDPVDERKLLSWTGRPFDIAFTCIDTTGGGTKKRRLICVYLPDETTAWEAISTLLNNPFRTMPSHYEEKFDGAASENPDEDELK